MLVDADLVELEEAAGGLGDHVEEVRHLRPGSPFPPPHDLVVVLCSAPSVPQPVFTITETEKAPARAFSWLKAPTSAFTFKTLC